MDADEMAKGVSRRMVEAAHKMAAEASGYWSVVGIKDLLGI